MLENCRIANIKTIKEWTNTFINIEENGNNDNNNSNNEKDNINNEYYYDSDYISGYYNNFYNNFFFTPDNFTIVTYDCLTILADYLLQNCQIRVVYRIKLHLDEGKYIYIIILLL